MLSAIACPRRLDVHVEATDIEAVARVSVINCQRDGRSGPRAISDRSNVQVEMPVRIRGHVSYAAAVRGKDRIEI